MRFVFIQTKILTPIYQVYQRAVINPMINIETLWKDYCSFEQSINPMIAEKLTQVGVGWELGLDQKTSLTPGEEQGLHERQESR